MSKKIKFSDLKKLSEKDLNLRLVEFRTELIKLNAQRSMGTALENPGKIKEIRKSIARVKTVANQKNKEGLKTK